mmetsp:Transcript_9762/g.31320  ORF Transcript_9762/g.31320 Transcript_9762/m.31320 type:complete len:450 (+) Transcript_9762:168-1517(+)
MAGEKPDERIRAKAHEDPVVDLHRDRDFEVLKKARHVYVYYRIHALSDIDTSKQQFTAEFYYRATWVENRPIDSGALEFAQDNEELIGNKVWNPRLVFPNMLEEVKLSKNMKVSSYLSPRKAIGKARRKVGRDEKGADEYEYFDFEYYKPVQRDVDLEGEGDDKYYVANGEMRKPTEEEKKRCVIEFSEIIRGTFSSPFVNLENFPYDTEDLVMTLGSSRSNAFEYRFHPDVWAPSRVLLGDRHLRDPEWTFLAKVIDERPEDGRPKLPFISPEKWQQCTEDSHKKFAPMLSTAHDDPNNRGHKIQVLRTSIKVKRKPTHYRQAIYFPVGIITAMEIGSYFFPPEAFEQRFSVTITLMLTLAAYKNTVTQYLPRLEKLTKCDRWVSSSFWLLGAAALEQLIAAVLAIHFPSQHGHGGFGLYQFDLYAKFALAFVFLFVYLDLYDFFAGR